MNILNLFTKTKEIAIKGADTLKQIKEKYGDNILPLEKAIPPFERVANGYGYKGVLLYNTEDDTIQCHYCGKWYKWLSNWHLRVHDMTPTEYKDNMGFNRRISLMSLGKRAQFEVRLKAQFRSNKGFKRHIKRLKTGKVKPPKTDQKLASAGTQKPMWKNRWGNCDSQLQARFFELHAELKRTPRQKDSNALTMACVRRFGSWNKAVEYFGLEVNRKSKRTVLEITKEIKRFTADNQRKPMLSDIQAGRLNVGGIKAVYRKLGKERMRKLFTFRYKLGK